MVPHLWSYYLPGSGMTLTEGIGRRRLVEEGGSRGPGPRGQYSYRSIQLHKQVQQWRVSVAKRHGKLTDSLKLPSGYSVLRIIYASMDENIYRKSTYSWHTRAGVEKRHRLKAAQRVQRGLAGHRRQRVVLGQRRRRGRRPRAGRQGLGGQQRLRVLLHCKPRCRQQ